jgi:hypothetical protein
VQLVETPPNVTSLDTDGTTVSNNRELRGWMPVHHLPIKGVARGETVFPIIPIDRRARVE